MNNNEANLRCGGTVAAQSFNGKWIAAGGYEHSNKGGDRGSCRVWDAATGKEIGVQGFPHRISHLAFAPNGEDLAIGTWDLDPDTRPEKNAIYLWSFLKGKDPIRIGERVESLEGFAFSANGKTLALVDRLSLHLWDMAIVKQQAKFDLPAKTLSPAFSPDGKTAVISNDGDRLFVMAVATGKLLRTIKAPNTFWNLAALSSDGKFMASCQRTIYFPDREYDPSIRLWELESGKEVLRFNPTPSAVSTLNFSADGHSLMSGMNNGTALIWNLKPKLVKAPLSRDLESLWADLADEDAGKAQQAIWTLVAAPKQSVPFLRERLKPVVLADQAKIQKWIADLGSTDFAMRQAAAKALEKVGRQVEPVIQNVLKGNTTLEARRRLEQILNTLAGVPGPETLRTIRAIMAMENIGSPEAQAILQALARGAPGARETEEAKGSLQRLQKTADSL